MQKTVFNIIPCIILIIACSKDPTGAKIDNTDDRDSIYQDTTNLDTIDQDTIDQDTIDQDTIVITYESIGEIIKFNAALDDFIETGTKIEILADGFNWSEGPVWIDNGNYVLFSDVPENRIYKWKEGEGISVYLEPSGYSGEGDYSSEPGSNGLILDAEGNLLLCQHGDRQVVKMNSTTDEPKPDFQIIADNYEGNKLNSPNDLAIHSDGSIYFTDPPYGLPGRENSSIAELDFYGVFKVDLEGYISLLTNELTRPNGIAFSPDFSKCYVNNSDWLNPVIMAYVIEEDGSFGEGFIFFDAKSKTKDGPGLPDGLCVHPSGTLFSTGPGGVLVISPEGEHLGTIKTTQTTSNCTFDSDYSNLYITADMYLLRVNIIN